MGFLKKIADIFTTSGSSGAPAYWIYVQCDRCGEKIKTRVNLHSDLSIRYAEKDDADTYFCRKMIIGNQRCFQKIEVEMTFDRNKKLKDRQISGGQFISEEEFSTN